MVLVDEQEAGLNSEKQTKVLLTVCWVCNHIRYMKNCAQWHLKSKSNVSFRYSKAW